MDKKQWNEDENVTRDGVRVKREGGKLDCLCVLKLIPTNQV